MKADIPAPMLLSMVSAKAGLATISAKMVSPAGINLYNEFVNDVPMKNKNGIVTMRPTDHLPSIVFGAIFKGPFDISDS